MRPFPTHARAGLRSLRGKHATEIEELEVGQVSGQHPMRVLGVMCVFRRYWLMLLLSTITTCNTEANITVRIIIINNNHHHTYHHFVMITLILRERELGQFKQTMELQAQLKGAENRGKVDFLSFVCHGA